MLVGGIVLLVTLATRAWRRTARRRHARDARLRVLGAWAEALDRLAWSGIEPRPSATPTEFALRHAPAHGAGAAGPPLMELARLQTTAMFAPEEPSAEDADLAWSHVDRLDAALRTAGRRTERLARRLRTRSSVSG